MTDDDTIEIHKDIEESVTINKNIIIKGNNHTLKVPQGLIGLNIVNKIEIYDLKFQVSTRAIAIATNHNIVLSNVETSQLGPVREFYSLIKIDAQYNEDDELIRSIKATITGSKIMGLTISNNVASNITDTKIHSYYKGDIMLSTRDDMSNIHGVSTFNNCHLKSVIISGNATMTNCTLSKYVDIDNSATLIDCVIDNEHEEVKKNMYKKEPANGPLSKDTKSKYTVAIRENAEVIIQNYTVSHVEPDYLGFYANDGRITISNINIDNQTAKHYIINSVLSFKDVNDKNYWDMENTTTAFVRSEVNSNIKHETAKNKLDKLIGQQTVKDEIESIMNTISMNQTTNNNDFEFSYNMIFAGSPGTGKTTIARIVAEALFEIGAIPENKFTTATSDEFVKGYVGQTGENTRRILDSALGGVLFIDEAYELTVKDNTNSFNSEVLSVLIRYMEDHRSDLVVIAAGYNKEMKEFLASNIGLSRRFQWIQFEDYTNLEMANIFEQMRISFGDEYETPELSKLIIPLFDRLTTTNLSIPDAKGHVTNGGNGGLVRNVYQQIVQARNNRYMQQGGTKALTKEDIATGFKAEINKAIQRKL